ncbi:hypothetical protein K3495_g14845 [Podosphaera aphanis]|nr:hypothetical protein K3495_g14845 [Podosphaera aphanis]
MEGLDTSELTLCETCHLSKAQRYVSREPRPTPFEPLDEVFIDTVGKLTTACNRHQYAVIITDAKSRMRWAITTNTKDQIAPQLVKWVEHQYHQFGKRVRTIFKDGRSEFSRIKTYCDQHGIRTDVSAPYTPEQNGASEASNKVILRKASYWSNHDSIFSEPSFHPAYPSHNTRTTTPHEETPKDQRESLLSTPDHSVINIQRKEIYDTAPSSPITIPHLDSHDVHIEPSSPLTSTPSHSTDLQVISYDRQLADQREISHEETSDDEAELTEQDEPYDQVMTGWDPVQPVAGVKRPHSPEGDITK